MRVLIVGCGYVGLPLGEELVRRGHTVFGLRRSSSATQQLMSAGIHPLTADITQPQDLVRVPGSFDWVVHCVASGGGGIEDYRRVYLQGTRNLVEWLAPIRPARFLYTSSTSVYGQNDGSVVDENSPAEPVSPTANVLVETERVLLQAAREQSLPSIILRLAGIYGPGRGHWLKQFLKGEARLEGKGDRFLNMIHRDDVIGAILAAIGAGRPGEIYNAVDDEPVTQRDLFAWLAATLGTEMPQAVPEQPGEGRKRGVTNKRVSNLKLKSELGYRLKHPDFRSGFTAELNASSAGRPRA